MVKSAPAVTEAGVKLVKAMVPVGPPLSAREPRLSTFTVVAQALVDMLVSRVTMLFAAVAEPIRITVPVP